MSYPTHFSACKTTKPVMSLAGTVFPACQLERKPMRTQELTQKVVNQNLARDRKETSSLIELLTVSQLVFSPIGEIADRLSTDIS